MKKTIKTLTATTTLTLAGFLASGQTFADEVKPVAPATETAVTTQAPTSEAKPTEAAAETTATPTPTAEETTATPTEAKPADTTVAPTEATPSEAVEEVHSPDLMSAVDKAKSLDIKVTEKPAVEYKTRAEAKADEDAQIITIDKAIAKKQAMDRERARIIALNTANAEENIHWRLK